MMTMEEFREKVIKELNVIYGREYEVFPLDLTKNNSVRRCGISAKRKDIVRKCRSELVAAFDQIVPMDHSEIE